MNIGILFAIIALFAWGLDDLFIEKATRKLGNVFTLFFVTIFGSLVLLPFVWTQITTQGFWSFNNSILILGLATLITIIAALLDYEALRTGKLSIVEPIYALEIPVTLAFGLVFIHERFTLLQIILVLAVTAGIFLVSSKSFNHFKHFTWERGVRMAVGSALFMGATNFLTGFSGRLTSPLVANWFIYTGIALCMLIWIVVHGQLRQIPKAIIKNPRIILSVSIADLIAWVSFAYSAFYIPIALATAISEAYVALGAILGLVINKEKLQRHQLYGIGVTIGTVIILSYIS